MTNGRQAVGNCLKCFSLCGHDWLVRLFVTGKCCPHPFFPFYDEPKNQALELPCMQRWRHTLSYQFQPCLTSSSLPAFEQAYIQICTCQLQFLEDDIFRWADRIGSILAKASLGARVQLRHRGRDVCR